MFINTLFENLFLGLAEHLTRVSVHRRLVAVEFWESFELFKRQWGPLLLKPLYTYNLKDRKFKMHIKDSVLYKFYYESKVTIEH